ncbi:MAG: radical SAM protein [Sterolibacterium sp.]
MEQEIFHKAGLLVDGANIEPAACEGVGETIMEKVWWLFVYDLQKQSGLKNVPDYIIFPKGTMVDFRWNPDSPYWIRKNDGILYLEKSGKFVCPIEFVERPEYYSKKTSSGTPMKNVGTLRGKHGLMVCSPLFCSNWVEGGPCKFCNMNPGMDEYDNKAVTKKKADEVGEVAAAMLAEGIDFHLVTSAGQPPKGRTTVQEHIDILEAIKKHTGLEKIPGTDNISPPEDLDELERLKNTGIQCLFTNIEVWNPDMFNYMCPGKTKRYGQEYFKDACDRAAKYWGRGNSWSAMVAGLEEKKGLLEGCKIMAERGTAMLMISWVPMVASELEGHRSPEAAWHVDLVHKAYEIYENYLPEVGSKEAYFTQYGCPSCITISINHDIHRLRQNIDEEYPAPHGPKGKFKDEKKGLLASTLKELDPFRNGKSEVLSL